MTGPQTVEQSDIQGIEDFLAIAKRNGFARANRFMVTFAYPRTMDQSFGDTKLMSLLCEEVTFPGRSLGTRTLRINGMNEQRVQTMDYMQDSLTMTFLVDSEWRVREFFEGWIATCVGKEIGADGNYLEAQQFDLTQPYRYVQFYDDYTSSVDLIALSPIPRTVVEKVVIPGWFGAFAGGGVAGVVKKEAKKTVKTKLNKILTKQSEKIKKRVQMAIHKKIYAEKNKLQNRYRKAISKFSAGLASKAPKGLRGIVGDITNDILPSHIFLPQDVAHIAELLPPEMLGYDPATGARKYSKLPESVNHVLDYLHKELIGYDPATGQRKGPPKIPENTPHVNEHNGVKKVKLGYTNKDGQMRYHTNQHPVKERAKEPFEMKTFAIHVHEVFPKAIEVQSMSSNSVDQYQRLKVTFVFRWFDSERLDFIASRDGIPKKSFRFFNGV